MIDPEQRAIDALIEKYRQALRLIPTDSLPVGAYNFDPVGWLLFRVDSQSGHFAGGDEYVAIHTRTGEARFLGRLGD